MTKAFDAIVVGARCAGSPTAMLLARKGYRVLAGRPRDLPERHGVHPRGAAARRRRARRDGACSTALWRPGARRSTPTPSTSVRSRLPARRARRTRRSAYCPRRTILDKLLVDAAAEAGAEVREGFTVEEILIEDGRVVGIKGRSKHGGTVTERAQVVVGADGRHSLVAEAVRPEQYNEKPPLLAGYYSYWSGLPMNGRFETYIRPNVALRPRRPTTV